MAQIMQDKYILGQSATKSIASIGQEIRLDLSLNPNTNSVTGGKVNGKISDINGQGVANALVKLMSTSYEPLMHTMTDASGNYSLVNVGAGSYNIFAIASGMKLKQGNQFSITDLQNVSANITLEQDPAMQLGIIAGDLINATSNGPVGGAVVSLFLKDASGNESLKAVTYTNQFGQYVFREVAKASYVVRISALGYTSVGANTSVTQDGQIVSMNVSITPNANTSNGTVSGVITNNQNQPVDRADVILYKVNANNSLTPVAFTKTNPNGVYLFTNVENGNYKVKSNQIELVDINVPGTWTYSPNFDFFTISPYDKLSVSATTAVLAGGAITGGGVPDGYVGAIGDAGGTATLTISVPDSGAYVFAMQYLSGTDSSRTLKVDVNGTATGQTYTFPKTTSWNAADAGIFNAYINLNQGSNTIKLYNSPNAPGPWVGMLSFNQIVSINSRDGLIENGATTGSGVAPGYVGAIGDAGGTLTISPTVATAGVYMLGVQYLCGSANTPLMVDVNGTSTGQTYTFPKTATWNVQDFKIYNIEVSLTQGTNTIKFYNSPNAAGPWVGQLMISPLSSKDSTTGQLAGGAITGGGVPAGYVGAVGDNGGTLTIDMNAPYAGKYLLAVKYISGAGNRTLQLQVNGTPTGQTYTFPNTPSWNASAASVFNIPVNLNAGANTFKFYNSIAAPGPWIGLLTLKPVAEISYYDATTATLQGAANIANGMVTGIGANLGSLTLTVPATNAGIYNFTIGYVAADNTKKSNIAVNNVSTGQTYTFTQTVGMNESDVKMKTIPLTLAAGSNTIKIYNEL